MAQAAGSLAAPVGPWAASVMRGVNSALTAVGIESPKLGSVGGTPNGDPLGETDHGVTPFRYGDHSAKFSLVPVQPALLIRKGRKIDPWASLTRSVTRCRPR